MNSKDSTFCKISHFVEKMENRWFWTHISRLVPRMIRKLDKYIHENVTKQQKHKRYMMTSPNGNIFRVTGLCEGNPPVTGGISSQRLMTRNFYALFVLNLNKRLNNNRDVGNLKRDRCHYDVTVMNIRPIFIRKMTKHDDVIMYKIYNQDVPHVFDNFFMYNYEVYDHETRSSIYFHVSHIKSNLSAFGIK